MWWDIVGFLWDEITRTRYCFIDVNAIIWIFLSFHPTDWETVKVSTARCAEFDMIKVKGSFKQI